MSRDQLYSEFHVSVSPDTTSSDSRLPEGILLSANVTSFHFETDEYWFRVDGIFQPYPPSPGEVLPPAQSLVLFRDNTDFYDFHISLLDTFPREAGRQPPHPRMIPYIPGTARDVDDILAITRRSELDDYVKTLCALSNVGAKYILEHQVVRKFLTIKPGDSKKLIPPRVPEMKALFGQGFPTALPHDSMCPHGSPLKPATGVLVYQTSVAFLKAACNPRLPGLEQTLDVYLTSRSSDDTGAISVIIGSVECRKTLLEISSTLGYKNDPDFRDALRTDEKHISGLLASVIDSESQKDAILRLEGESAQGFLDTAQDAVDRGLLGEEHAWKTRRLILKLSESSGKLPSCLFITGVTGRGEHPTFGGGFGDVYQAEYSGKTVALKHMRRFLRSSDMRRRLHLKFCREALVWRELHHPHILPFIGIDRESFSSSLCMVSPWMGHGTVLVYLENHGRGKVDKMLFEIAQGLQYLHSRNIVHGDLRGGNILINEDWSSCLADFGLSGFSNATSSMRTSTRAGSLRWMAPELIDPDRFGYKFARTPASDIYAFGCVCVELYTGRPPFSELSEPAALLKVVNGERASRPSGSPAMSDVFWQRVTKYWAENPATRPVAESIVQDMVLKRRRLQLPKPAPSRALPPLPDRLSAGRMSPLISLSAALPTNEACDEEEDLACKIADAVNAVATSEDWALVVHVCDRASTNERNAQVAVSALCQVFKHEHSDPLRQIGAARLWSIMLSNCSDIFIEQSNSLHFIHALEDLLTSSRTSVKVRECVIQALADAVSARGANVGFRMLWQRVKPLASSPIPSSSDLSFWDDESDDDSDAAVAPVVTHQDGAPTLSDEDVQWLFNECQTGVGNAKLLRQALATIAPELGNTTNIIGEYHKKCIDSHQIIFTQIRRVVGPERSQREEDLLSALLAANETLLETLKLYDDVKRGMKWIVCKVFAVTLPDELVVTMGEVLHVLSQYTDQWALCENARGELGMVPLECLLELRATE